MTEPNTPETPSTTDPVQALQEQLATAEKERATYLALAQRTQADFENYQQRLKRELASERQYAVLPLARDLLPALDNLERALAAARQAGDTGALTQGVIMVQSQLLDVLRRNGIVRIEALNEPFDPNLHEAMMEQPTAEAPPQTVVMVLEQGYKIHDRVLRPARVAVAVAPKE
jgi:molecular chaperone GrpE